MRLRPFVQAIGASTIPIVIADPFTKDLPVVFVNAAFLAMTGYEEHEVLGRNCRFLQGPETELAHRSAIGSALASHTAISQEILNYRKDGSTFWNELHVAPMYGDDGTLLYYIATQIDVTQRVLRAKALETEISILTSELRQQAEQAHHMAQEMAHRVRNSLTLVQTMMRLQISGSQDNGARQALIGALGRISAIVEIQRVIERSDIGMSVNLKEILESICLHLNEISDAVVTTDVEDIAIPEGMMTPIALIVSELVTNAQKHSFLGMTSDKTIAVTARVVDDGAAIGLSVRDNGVGLAETFDPKASKGFGAKMLLRQAHQLGAELTFARLDRGTEFAIVIPMDNATR